jgi:glycosyltransferase involved in cell wall biosynthesis
MQQIAAVVIGRNEGDNLKLSLQSVRLAGLSVVYADSGSTDGSAALARDLGFPAIELDPSRPFSAARGRNEGLGEALKHGFIEYVLFLDGDCILDPDFPPAAVRIFEQNPDCAIVTGHLSELHPEASIYTRVCAIDWRGPAC